MSLEPHSKPVYLQPGQSAACSFTLANDSRDVPFQKPPPWPYQRPLVPETIVQGGLLKVCARATTVENKPESVGVAFAVKDPQGKVLLAKTVGGEARPFAFTDPMRRGLDRGHGGLCRQYHWSMSGGDGRELRQRCFEVVSAEEQGRRQLATATAESAPSSTSSARSAGKRSRNCGKVRRTLEDEPVTLRVAALRPQRLARRLPPAGAAVGYRPAVIPVPASGRKGVARDQDPCGVAVGGLAGRAGEAARRAPLGPLHVCDVVPDAAGKGLVARCGPGEKTHGNRRAAQGAVRRFGRYADKPGESDDTLVAGAGRCGGLGRQRLGGYRRLGANERLPPRPGRLPLEESVLGTKGC